MFSNDVDITEMAAALAMDSNATFNLSKEGEDLIKGSTVNTKRYGKTKKGVEMRFFDTIEQYGGPQLQKLLTIKKNKNKIETERLFYFVL
jgi:hypothetical protein